MFSYFSVFSVLRFSPGKINFKGFNTVDTEKTEDTETECQLERNRDLLQIAPRDGLPARRVREKAMDRGGFSARRSPISS